MLCTQCNGSVNIAKYVKPYMYCHLCTISIEANQINEARLHLKNSQSYGSYELQDRLSAHMRNLERLIDHKSSSFKK